MGHVHVEGQRPIVRPFPQVGPWDETQVLMLDAGKGLYSLAQLPLSYLSLLYVLVTV